MKNKNVSPIPVSQSEAQLLERLRQHPEIMERVQSILEIAYNTDGPLKSADQVEELLIQEMRRLGNASMHQWATQAEQRVSRELKVQDGTVRSRKKKTLKWCCVFGWVSVADSIFSIYISVCAILFGEAQRLRNYRRGSVCPLSGMVPGEQRQAFCVPGFHPNGQRGDRVKAGPEIPT